MYALVRLGLFNTALPASKKCVMGEILSEPTPFVLSLKIPKEYKACMNFSLPSLRISLRTAH